jgi:Domain of unknown function (DUF4386)
MISSRAGGSRLGRVTGALYVASAVTFAGSASVLSSTFNWPDILRQPAGVMLPAFAAGGTSLVWTWFATAWTYGLLAVPMLLLPAALGRGHDVALRVATYAGALSVVLSLIGFLRWVFVVPALARSYVGGDATTRAGVDAAWTSQHQFGGALLGEHLGQLLAIGWSVTLSVIILRSRLLPRWLGVAGLAVSAIYLLNQGDILATAVPGFPVWDLAARPAQGQRSGPDRDRLIGRATHGQDQLRRSAGRTRLLRPTCLQPVEAGQRPVHLRAGAAPDRQRCDRHRVTPRRGTHPLRRRGSLAHVESPPSSDPASPQESTEGRRHVDLPGVLTAGRGRHRHLLRQLHAEDLKPGLPRPARRGPPVEDQCRARRSRGRAHIGTPLVIEHLADNRYEAIDVARTICADGCWYDRFLYDVGDYAAAERIDTKAVRVLDTGRDSPPRQEPRAVCVKS